MPMDLQVKLLRVLQERVPARRQRDDNQGGCPDCRGDKREPAGAGGKGDFRGDLYYRLNVIPISVPPLRQRRDDIPQLVGHFIEKYCAEQQLRLKRVSHDAIRALMGYEWPGNVRQLENSVEMAVALSGDRDLLDLEDFPVVSRRPSKPEKFDTIEIPDDGIHFNTMISELERKLILQSLQIARGNKKRAASLLHLKRTTFVEKLRRMGMDAPDEEIAEA